jgi:hypothetical protein
LRPAAARTSNDIIVPNDAVHLGANWYPLEFFAAERFRWVDNDAQFSVTPSHNRVAVELQPGPGIASTKMILKLLDSSGQQIQASEITGRRTIQLLLPNSNGKQATYRLHVDGGGKLIPSDPRTLNFRVFKLKALD